MSLIGLFMKFYAYYKNLNRIQELASRSATGAPKELAKKLNVSQRTLYRLVQDLKNQGISIEYCRKKNSYWINN